MVKRYVPEVGSAWVSQLSIPAGANSIFVSIITSVEVAAALARRSREGSVTSEEMATAIAQLDQDLHNDLLVVELTTRIVQRAKQIALTHVIRGYDAVQLATALETDGFRAAAGESPLIFVSADSSLNAVATAEGLTVEDPNSHP